MRPFVYDQLGGRVVFGVGTLDRVPEEVERLAAGGNILLVADDMAKGEADWIQDACQDRVVSRIGEIRPHVPVDDVDRARRIVNQNAIDVVVTVGGGSTTGLGKAIVLEHEMPFLAVPTTYAGSEMTPIYGMTGEDVKRTGRDPKVKPGTVVYDVELTLGLPMSVTAGSVMNALAHCVEALYAEQRNPIVDLLALEGVTALFRGSGLVSRDPESVDGRSDLLYGAYLAGTSLGSVGMAVHHRLCHVLGGTFGLAHGDSNAVILPHVAAYNAVAEPGVMGRLASTFGVDDPAAALYDVARELGAPAGLSELGVAESDLDVVAAMTVEQGGYNPRPIELAWIRSLLGDAYTGESPILKQEY